MNVLIEISKGTILTMLEIMDRFNAGKDVRADLSRLLEHEDYKIEIERYQNHPAKLGFTKEDFINYFINIRSFDMDSITSKALKYRTKDLLHIIDNLDYYRGIYKQIEKIDDSFILRALEKAKVGLPDDIALNDIKIIFSIGLGVSGGWIYKNYTHYDLGAVLDKKTVQGLMNTIAHECHHIGYNRLFENIDESNFIDHMDILLVLYLSCEGTAIKYCNNYQGKLTGKIYEDQEMSINYTSYDYYLTNFRDIYDTLRDDIKDLRLGMVKKTDEFEDLFNKHYLFRDVKIEDKVVENYLGQPIAYHLGADMWGLIHDVYGRQKVFELLKNPIDFFKYYNNALIKINKQDLCIYD